MSLETVFGNDSLDLKILRYNILRHKTNLFSFGKDRSLMALTFPK